MTKAETFHYTAATVVSELKNLARVHRRAKRGYREVLRRLMGNAARILDRLANNENLSRKFVLKLKPLRPNNQNLTQKLSLSTEVMAIIIGAANSRSARKRAWKYGRVVDVLRNAGISADSVPDEIKKRGGIERIYRKSVDRRTDASIRSKQRSKSEPAAQLHPRSSQADIGGGSPNNSEILVAVYMSLADRDEILEMPNGATVRLKTVKIDQPKALLKVRSIRCSDSRLKHPAKTTGAISGSGARRQALIHECGRIHVSVVLRPRRGAPEQRDRPMAADRRFGCSGDR